jgi:hypothetical protein
MLDMNRLDIMHLKNKSNLGLLYTNPGSTDNNRKHELLLNTLIFISKWSIWKARNKVKYDKIHINQNVLCNIWKQTLKSP